MAPGADYRPLGIAIADETTEDGIGKRSVKPTPPREDRSAGPLDIGFEMEQAHIIQRGTG
jgi:hypothetical protein